jgi:hypothetical protein
LLIRNAEGIEEMFDVYVVGLSATAAASHQYYEYIIDYILKSKENYEPN